MTMNDAWMEYKGDFNAMTDAEIDSETEQAKTLIDENESWVDAVASWKVAGKPRTEDGTHDND